MMRSLFSAISGLKGHQTMMDENSERIMAGVSFVWRPV